MQPVWRTVRRHWPFAMLVTLTMLPALAVACEKNNDLVAQQQFEDARNVCSSGCEVPPPGCTVKGNISVGGNKIYHTKDQASWAGIRIQVEKGERWFCSEQQAIANGFRKSIN